jgi:hypothetical protein
MTTPKIFLVNAETGAKVLRELNQDELEQLAIDQAKAQDEAEKEAAQNEAKQLAEAKLEALGFTADELIALGLKIKQTL